MGFASRDIFPSVYDVLAEVDDEGGTRAGKDGSMVFEQLFGAIFRYACNRFFFEQIVLNLHNSQNNHYFLICALSFSFFYCFWSFRRP